MKKLTEEAKRAYENRIDDSIDAGAAKILTLASIKELKGKTIFTKYFGYAGQDGTDYFTVGELKLDHCTWGNQDPEYHRKKAQENAYFDKVTLITEDGRNTFIRGQYNYHEGNEMWCSDEDRFVFYIIVD